MKKILYLVSMVMASVSVFAQAPSGMPGNGKMQAPAIGHVYGKLVDSAGKPIADASVLLMQTRFDSVSKKNKEVLFKGSTTKAGGEFSFEGLPVFGKLKLKISATGYKPIEQAIVFKMPTQGGAAPKQPGDMSAMMNGFDRDLGNIKMVNDVQQLQAVVVSASKPTLKMDIDKKVYNVEKDIVNAGGTALDVMKNVPSVNVDIDGNVTLRNSSPQIYVDGRPTTLTLDQIPADAIESVEVITNPSAKYDASGGGAGILNVVLKKNKKTGYNGNLRAGIDKNGAMNGGGDFSVRQGKFNVNASAMLNQMNGKTNGVTNRYNFTGTPNTSIYQTDVDRNKGEFIFGRFGLDYFATNRNTFSLTGFRVHGEFKPTSVLDMITDSLYNNPELYYSSRYSNTNRIFNGEGLQFGFKHIFPKQGEEWTVDANYFQGKNSNNSTYLTDYFTDASKTNIGAQSNENILGYGSDKNFIIQTDYVDPISSTLKLETGLRAALRSRITNTDSYIDTTKLANASTDYTNSDNVYAAYVSLTGNMKTFGYKLGLRAESSNYSGELTNVKQTYSNSYPISLFPSIFLSQKLKSNQEVQFSITRRINRPNFFQLIPYTDYSDSLNITRGNPALVPEFTNSFELSYIKTFKGNNTFLASAYYKRTNNLITRFLDTSYNALSGKKDIINTYENANYSNTMGAEFTSQNTLTRWLDISTNINVYNSKINTDNINGSSQPALWSWFGKFNSNFKLPAKFSMQLTAMYQSKTNLPVNNNQGGMGGPPGMQSQSSSQGYIKSFYGVDIAFKKTFLKNDAASVSLSFSDIFRSRWSDQYSYSSFFTQEYDRLRDPQMVRLNFSYRFGKMDVSLFKRKSQGVSDNGSGDMQ